MSRDSTGRLRAFFGDEGERALEPEGKLGRYALRGELGRGAMAVVYLAHDPELDREVAIKVLRDGPGERLRREATAAARLRHPNVVTIHEVGPDYIVMERISGRTLAAALPSLSREQRVETLETVARAVAYAHGEGVVHRDLKPENVLVEDGGRIVLTDFGLAKTEGAADLTRPGSALGTPHYMAPEGVRGEIDKLGPLADVWSLGVMLYEAVADGRPFTGASVADVYEAILRSDPPRLPGPLGAVVARALEKEPARRYPDAATLAEDLARCRRGEPPSVRVAGPLGHLAARIRRRPLPFAAAAAIAVAVAATVLLVAWGRAARAELVEALREKARLSLHAALELRRAGAGARMRQFLPPLEAAYHEARARAPGLAEIEYLMGRMHRALLDEDAALAAQERALAKDPRFVPALYERALLLSLRHGRAWQAAAAAPESAAAGTISRSRELGATAAEVRSAWEAYLSALPPAERDTPAATLARGLAAEAHGEHARARGLIQRALQAEPLLEEGWESLARVVFADRLTSAHEREQVWSQTEARLGERLAQDRGYTPHLVARGQLRWTRGAQRRHRGLDPLPDYDAAERDLDEAIRLAPQLATAWSWRGVVKVYRAVWKIETGGDPSADVAAAEADTTRAIALAPRAFHGWMWRGNARFYLGFGLEGRGQSGVAALEAAGRDLDETHRLAPRATDVLRWRGRQRALLGGALARAGRDPSAAFAGAAADFAAITTQNDPWALIWESTLYTHRAEWRLGRGEDATQDFDAAERILDRALRLDRNQMEIWKHRGLVHWRRARAAEDAGRRHEARLRFASASADLHQALTLNPTLEHQVGEQARVARQRAIALAD